MIRRPPRSTQSRSSAASDVYKRQISDRLGMFQGALEMGVGLDGYMVLPIKVREEIFETRHVEALSFDDIPNGVPIQILDGRVPFATQNLLWVVNSQLHFCHRSRSSQGSKTTTLAAVGTGLVR
eukprot:TRINITY_DN14368_c0_g1_i1.p1 TRINITY_DN14368_c0_g1~~TRINITY_DN14368_c0_g1_i1.p1  ORF type:complete len:124 (+),score=29.49 TRINITY_DN14368_c0_g1_i1:141-512(+)